MEQGETEGEREKNADLELFACFSQGRKDILCMHSIFIISISFPLFFFFLFWLASELRMAQYSLFLFKLDENIYLLLQCVYCVTLGA